MRKILLVLSLVVVVFGADKITKPYTFYSGTPALASQVNKNYDSIIAPTNKLIDTVNLKIPRWAGVLRNKDSVTSWINIDTIKGPVNIDSITAGKRITVDSVIGAVRGNVTGNVSGTAATVTGAAQPTITSVGTLTGLTSSGTVSVDSLYSTKGITGSSGTFSGLTAWRLPVPNASKTLVASPLYTDSGNTMVGIGVVPTVDLHIKKSTNGSVRIIADNESSVDGAYSAIGTINNSDRQLQITTFSSGFTGTEAGIPYAGLARLYSDAVGGLLIHQNLAASIYLATNDVVRATITAAGLVGIGFTTPLAKLAINGGLHVGGESDPGDNNLLVDGNVTVDSGYSAKSWTAKRIRSDSATVPILTGDVAVRGKITCDTIVGKLTVDSLGIGTTPTNKLHVVQSATGSPIKIATTAANSSCSMQFLNDTQEWSIGVRGDASDEFVIRNATGGQDVASFTTGNRFGIGTTATENKLEVKGNISDTGNLFVTGGITAGGKITCDTLTGPITVDSMRVGGGDWLGKIVVDTGHTAATGAFTFVNFPTGFTKDNCVVISVAVEWVAGVSWISGYLSSIAYVGVDFEATQYGIWYPDAAGFHNAKYKIVLMRISK